MKQKPNAIRFTAQFAATVLATMLAAMPATAQQITGTPVSPDATDGKEYSRQKIEHTPMQEQVARARD